MSRSRLRAGFTTGSAAAAAAKAALLAYAGRSVPDRMDIPLPPGGRLSVPVAGARRDEEGARACVVKDGGDDPDATHGARISVRVNPLDETAPAGIVLEGGVGVGRVTKPGLPVEVGEAAINPAPREQIAAASLEAMREAGLSGSFRLRIEVEQGERIARKTMNPRLGIVGGVSILGTRGTVQPFSSASYTGTITSALDVALAAGCETAGLCTGGRSERFLRAVCGSLPDETFVLTADYFAFSLREAAARGFRDIRLGCFFGKLVKMGQGHAYTHARSARLDFPRLARWCAESGISRDRVRLVRGANTAREALEIMREDPRCSAAVSAVAERALASARYFAGPAPGLGCYLFDFDGALLHRAQG
jgi:cobalt-precorrin-5B (C1)-methyltransferase